MAGDSLITTHWVELGLAAFTAGLGGIVMVGSLEQGIGWGDAGPEPGYFPFYIGLLLTLASLATALQTLWRWQALRTSFVERAAFGRGIYLIALTGFGSSDDREEARKAGFDAHLVKPAELDEIIRLLARAERDGGMRAG